MHAYFVSGKYLAVSEELCSMESSMSDEEIIFMILFQKNYVVWKGLLVEWRGME